MQYLGQTYTKKLCIVYLKLKFDLNLTGCPVFLLNLATLNGIHRLQQHTAFFVFPHDTAV